MSKNTDTPDHRQQAPFIFAIRAVYARRILDGSKRWEFRTRMPSVRLGDLALIYESRGRGRIVGAFTVGSLLHTMSPGVLWQTVEEMDPGSHGIDRSAYNAYFEGRAAGVAIGVVAPVALDWPLPPGMHAPQSWARWVGPWHGCEREAAGS